jgi:pimeloyl-ACP methyl ester carboxylesterase
MAKLMSKKTKEIVQTSVVIAIVVLFLIFYVIYPLIVIPKMTARPDRDKYDKPDFALPNDPSCFTQIGLSPDTFVVMSNDNLRLASLYFTPDLSQSTPKGTAIFIHPDDTDRTALADLIKPLLDTGLAVVIYDQRASGKSGGKYHFTGNFEADDLTEITSWLSLHGKLFLPVTVIGFELGADAAINASRLGRHISNIIAINPSLTTTKWMASRINKYGALPIPLANMTYFWWYQKICSYPDDRTGVDDIKPLETPTLILISDPKEITGKEISKLRAISPSDKLQVSPCPTTKEELDQLIIKTLSPK